MKKKKCLYFYFCNWPARRSRQLTEARDKSKNYRVQQKEKAEALRASRGAIRKELTTLDRAVTLSGPSVATARNKSPSLSTSSVYHHEKNRSPANLSPINLDYASMTKPIEFTLSNSNLRARSPLELVGRRLSHGDGGESPPPTPKLGTTNFGGTSKPLTKCDTVTLVAPIPVTPNTKQQQQQRSPAKRGQSFPAFATLRTPSISGQQQQQHYQVSSHANFIC